MVATRQSTCVSNRFGCYPTINGFLWKVSKDGTALWVVAVGGNKLAAMNAVTVDADGNAITAGYFTSPTATFDGSQTATNAAEDEKDAVLWKVSSAGTSLWAQTVTDLKSSVAYAVTSDSSSNIYAVGNFVSGSSTNQKHTFGTGTSSVDGLCTNDCFNAWVWKLSSSGTPLWHVIGGGVGGPTYPDILHGVALQSTGDVVAAGA